MVGYVRGRAVCMLRMLWYSWRAGVGKGATSKAHGCSIMIRGLHGSWCGQERLGCACTACGCWPQGTSHKAANTVVACKSPLRSRRPAPEVADEALHEPSKPTIEH